MSRRFDAFQKGTPVRRIGRMAGLAVAAMVIMVGVVVAHTGKVAADVNDFTVTDFAANYYLSDSDAQGVMRIQERIQVNFKDQNHGLLRAIPQTYNKHPLRLSVKHVSSDTGAPTKYKTETSNGNTVLRVGDANKTVTGQQEYTIEYTLSNVLDFYVGQPELYWNVNGTGWSQPFDHVSAVLHLEGGLTIDTSAHKPACYSGLQGEKGSGCVTTFDSSNLRLFKVETTNALPINGNLSFAVAINGKKLHTETWQDRFADFWKPVAAALVLPAIVFTYAFRAWLKRGRDDKGRGVIVPMYDAPNKLTPLEVGAVADFNPDNRDITATLIDLAIRKYIRIVETKTDRLIGKDKLEYELILLNTKFDQLNSDERKLLSALFPKLETNAAVKVSAASTALAATAKTISSDVEQRLTTNGYFKANPMTAGAKLYGYVSLLVVAAIFLAQVLHPLAIAGAALSGVIAFIFARIMPARTAKGVAALEHVKGLKMYLQTAEADRIKMMQSPNAPYASDHQLPVKTIELFEKLLPYAIVLGVEKDWAKQFEGLYATPPDWYGGFSNVNAFNIGYLAGSLGDNFQGAVATSFSPPSSSGSSGFGGGGFSGGGGGGGGGGGW